MEAPGVPRGAAPVRGPPPAAQHSPELEPRPPSSLRFSQPWQCPQRQTSEAPGGPEALSTLDLPLRGPPETKVTRRTAMHPAPTAETPGCSSGGKPRRPTLVPPPKQAGSS